MPLDGSMQSKITATVLGLAAEIEREFISMRTKEALAARKQEGVVLGRPVGPASSLKLDGKRAELAMNFSIRKIAKLIDSAPSMVSDYIKIRLSD